MPFIEGNKLEVGEVWQEVEQAPCTLHMLKTASLHSVEEACPAKLHHSGFFCGNHQPKIFFEIPNVSAACEGSSKLPKRLVFQRKSLVGDFRTQKKKN